jgi:hypothetical protein
MVPRHADLTGSKKTRQVFYGAIGLLRILW